MSAISGTMCQMKARKIVGADEIGRRILAAREKLRLNQQELADKAGLSRAYISRLERGLIPNPTITDLQKVAEAAEVSLVDLTMERSEVVMTRYSTDLDELRRQLDSLPPDKAERILRGYLESAALMAEMGGLARRN